MQVAALGNGFLGPGNAELGSYVRHIPVRAVEEWDCGGRKAVETSTVMAGHQMQDGCKVDGMLHKTVPATQRWAPQNAANHRAW
jgi:hypothetical protein